MPSWVYDNPSRGHRRAVTNERLEPGVGICGNLGTGRGTSLLDVTEADRETTGHPIPAVIGPRRAGDLPQLVADARRAQKILNWEPRFTQIREPVQTAWQWHQTHPRGFQN